jgi:hypothetical protein
MSIKPPPPMFPACGRTTARAKPTATAASTALPPSRRISTPASVASWWMVTTMAWSVRAGAVWAISVRGASASQPVTKVETDLRMF